MPERQRGAPSDGFIAPPHASCATIGAITRDSAAPIASIPAPGTSAARSSRNNRSPTATMTPLWVYADRPSQRSKYAHLRV